MTNERFADIAIGTPITSIEQDFGKPISIKSAARNQQVYEYIERINMGTNVIQVRRYYLVVSKGKVVGKYVRYTNPPPYSDIYNEEIFPES